MPTFKNTENHELAPRMYREEEQHSKISIQQSQPIPIVAPSGKQPMPCMCPYCHHLIVSRVEKSNGLVVWLASAGICLLGCAVGCCLIPFFIDDLKHPFNKTYLVGNGGFSLRSRSKILALLQLIQYDSFPPEDVWYAQNLHRVNASIAPVHIAKTFAVESVFYERPVGVHRFTWGCKFRRKISETCPESVMVLPNEGC
ncbi:unnamed protein product [Adineta steineri]|uniref:LITAF domain-containing protein n=1 Tax=Adineta steineri TaxID=433720 RepID=A0A818IPY1_9BILA|nr:unnamed protein product [Adineta steineri]CAF3528014.1 unnamed protein product [Adineta steineri]